MYFMLVLNKSFLVYSKKSHNDVVYIRLDVRGAKGQGKKALFRHLGGVEVQDQMAVLR